MSLDGMQIHREIINQLDSVIKDGEVFSRKPSAEHRNNFEEITRISARAVAAIERITGTDSSYSQRCADVRKAFNPINAAYAHALVGVVRALRQDVADGYLQSLVESIHDDVFSDYLSMAEHLLRESFKDAAAVIAGGTLEQHLRQLCVKHGIDLTQWKSPMINSMNDALKKKGVYTESRRKQITFWADIRNNAAHANYELVDTKQVEAFIRDLATFIADHPA